MLASFKQQPHESVILLLTNDRDNVDTPWSSRRCLTMSLTSGSSLIPPSSSTNSTGVGVPAPASGTSYMHKRKFTADQLSFQRRPECYWLVASVRTRCWRCRASAAAAPLYLVALFGLVQTLLPLLQHPKLKALYIPAIFNKCAWV